MEELDRVKSEMGGERQRLISAQEELSLKQHDASIKHKQLIDQLEKENAARMEVSDLGWKWQ